MNPYFFPDYAPFIVKDREPFGVTHFVFVLLVDYGYFGAEPEHGDENGNGEVV